MKDSYLNSDSDPLDPPAAVFVTPGTKIVDISASGILHVDSSTHIVDNAVVAATTGYARTHTMSNAGDTGTATTTTVITVDHGSRRYVPRKGDSVLGVVTKQGNAEYHEVDVGRGRNRVALLPVLGFDNATKRNRPMLKAGDVVSGKVVEVFDGDRVVMDCVNESASSASSASSEGYGPIDRAGGGMVWRVTPAYARWLLTRGGIEVLRVLGGKVPFEIVVGVNGMFWVASQEKDKARAFLETCIVGSTICELASDFSGGDGVDAKRVLQVLKTEMAAR